VTLMKQAFFAALLATSTFAHAGGSTFPPEDYDYKQEGSIQEVLYGTIESVRRVDFQEHHPDTELRPMDQIGPREQTGEELVVRLDTGGAVAVVQGGSRGFQSGQRVRVLTGPRGARVELT
jgi:outer membrane lipoprotein SlyB